MAYVQSGVINVENKEKNVFVAHVYKTFRLHPLTPFDLHSEFCAKWKTLWSYITQINFLQTKNLVFNLETFKSRWSNHFESILDGFSWNTPPNVVQFVQQLYIWSNIAEILTRSSTLTNKNIVWKMFEETSFYEKGSEPKLAFLVQHWPPISNWR